MTPSRRTRLYVLLGFWCQIGARGGLLEACSSRQQPAAMEVTA